MPLGILSVEGQIFGLGLTTYTGQQAQQPLCRDIAEMTVAEPRDLRRGDAHQFGCSGLAIATNHPSY